MPVALDYVTPSQALYWYVTANGVIDVGIGSRMYPIKLPGNPTLPAIVYQQFGEPSQLTHSGPSGYDMVRIQLAVIAQTYTELVAVSQRLRRLLNGAKGVWAGLNVQSVGIENEFDAPEPPESALHRRLFEIYLEFSAQF